MPGARSTSPPEKHPRLAPEELAYIRADRAPQAATAAKLPAAGWGKLLRYKQTWGIMLGRFLLDPYWFMVAEWFALYLMSKGFQIERSILGFWAPFLGADLGNFFGGALSSYTDRFSFRPVVIAASPRGIGPMRLHSS